MTTLAKASGEFVSYTSGWMVPRTDGVASVAPLGLDKLSEKALLLPPAPRVTGSNVTVTDPDVLPGASVSMPDAAT